MIPMKIKYRGTLAKVNGEVIYRIYEDNQILCEFKNLKAGLEYIQLINKHGKTNIFSITDRGSGN
jgi:hypothetical protein